MQIENKNYKDTVFRMLCRDKMRLLELYNAINKSSYDNPDDLTITTLEGETFLNMKNDVSFLLDFELNLFEHQSSPCPNIPLRDLEYVASIYRELIPSEETFKASRIEIPAPRFIVFYNGTMPMNDNVTYKLSDMFAKKGSNPQLELIVTLLNVNVGHNKELMEQCQTLKQYSLFVAKVRKYREMKIARAVYVDNVSAKTITREAVTLAIDECIEEDILKDFFVKYREEVIEVGVLEYSAERHLKVIADENFENGYNSGYDTGYDTGFNTGSESKEKELKPIITSLESENERLRKLLEDNHINI